MLDPSPPYSVAIVVDASASELERFAAAELSHYVKWLFGAAAHVTAQPTGGDNAVILLGTPETLRYTGFMFQEMSEQSFSQSRISWAGYPAMLLTGGSARAVMWAVYDLVERWGVRYLLQGDVFPETPGAFWQPAGATEHEPALPIRQWRIINDFACGPESWGVADYRPVIDQLAKLKFNRLHFSLWPWQPFVHYEHKGISRRSAYLWFDYHYPITDDMIGRELFGDEEEFWNPDIPRGASYADMLAAGQQHVRNLMDYGHQRGMECVLSTNLTEFMPEFAPLLPGAQTVHQLAGLTIVPGTDTPVDDPQLTELASVVLQATVNTYPEADAIALGMTEHRQWIGQYEAAWQALDRRYGIESVQSLDAVLAAARQRTGYAGGAERPLDEVKGDIISLYFYNRLLRELPVLEHTSRPDMRFIFNGVAEELFPVLPRLLPAGWELMNNVDYTPARILTRREVLRHTPDPDIPATLIHTLHDDNVGVLPQLATGSLHELTQDMYRHGWAGFSTRYWLVGDHDPCIAYLAKSAWERDTTPETVYRDQITALWGEDCVDDMLTVFRELEAATVTLEWHGMGLTFPVPGMMMKHWTPGDFPAELVEVRERYQVALRAARRVAAASSPRGQDDADYWVGRFEFGIAYLEALEAVSSAANAEHEQRPTDARRAAETALAAARRALEAYARVARDQSDRGAIATMNEYVFRPLRAKVEALQAV